MKADAIMPKSVGAGLIVLVGIVLLGATATAVEGSGWSGGVKDRVWLDVAADGGYSLTFNGELWLDSGPTEVTVDGKVRSSADGSLILTSTDLISGTDALGQYTGVAQSWSLAGHAGINSSRRAPMVDGGGVMVTAFLMGADGATLRFNTSFPAGVRGASVLAGRGEAATFAAWGTPSTAFPSFSLGKGRLATGPNPLGYVGYQEIGRPSGGIFPVGYKGSGEEDGVPLALVDPLTQTAAMLSPSAQFYDTVFGFSLDTDDEVPSATPPTLRCGVIGTADSIPAGWQTQVILQYANRGLTDTVMSWGDALLALHGKHRPGSTATVQVERLGLSTVGHYFYGAAYNATMESTLAQLATATKAAGLSFGYVLIDSMWYREGAVPTPDGRTDPGFGGMWRWDDTIARAPEMFPSGLAALRKELGVPFVMHMGEWVGNASESGAPPYASTPSWDWVVEEKASIPRANSAGGRAFWDNLFESMAANGLTTYKLDHSQQQMPNMK